MKVILAHAGVQFIPFTSIEFGPTTHVKHAVGTTAMVHCYRCAATNGVTRTVLDQDLIPDGVYDLPDADWEPDAYDLADMRQRQLSYADEAIFIDGERI